MATVTPTFSDNVSVIASTTLARGSTSRATLDWRTKRGGFIFIHLGRGGTTALTNGVTCHIRRTINNAGIINPAATAVFTSKTAAASSTTVNSDSNSGQNAVNVTSESGFSTDDIICIQDAGGGVTRLEWGRVAKTATGIITLDAPLQYTHTAAQADTVRSKADAFAVWVDGGATYEVIIDYADDSAGDTLTLRVLAQTYDSDTSA